MATTSRRSGRYTASPSAEEAVGQPAGPLVGGPTGSSRRQRKPEGGPGMPPPTAPKPLRIGFGAVVRTGKDVGVLTVVSCSLPLVSSR